MMLDANVPIIFWPEAIRTACYLHQRSPTSSLMDNRSPYEALYGTIPKIGDLRRFGCREYKHIPPNQRTEKKFGNRSSMCMMLGYVHNTTKIWRIWDFKSGRTGRAVECSSVVFDEEENAHTEEQTEAIEFPDATEKRRPMKCRLTEHRPTEHRTRSMKWMTHMAVERIPVSNKYPISFAMQ